jgi:UDP-GlcNAc:undecaprenyl-phosphate/decaprenyl-phosphate GlcNAc-1-phosphate transferase
LTWQIGIALLAMGFGFVIQTIQIPFFQAIDLGFWAWPLTVLWIVGMMNAVNLIDGLDCLAIGITIIALVCLATICLWQGQIPWVGQNTEVMFKYYGSKKNEIIMEK